MQRLDDSGTLKEQIKDKRPNYFQDSSWQLILLLKNIFIHQYYEILADLHEKVETGKDPDNIGKTGINCHKRPNIAIESYRALKKINVPRFLQLITASCT